VAARGGRGIGADGDQALMDLGGAHAVRLPLQLGEQRRALGVCSEHGIEQCGVAARRLLRHMAKARAGGKADLPRVRAARAVRRGDHCLEQGGLARAVPPDKTHLAARVHGEVRPFEQGAAGDAEREAADEEHGHGTPL
jgi:hypothetical protein